MTFLYELLCVSPKNANLHVHAMQCNAISNVIKQRALQLIINIEMFITASYVLQSTFMHDI